MHSICNKFQITCQTVGDIVDICKPRNLFGPVLVQINKIFTACVIPFDRRNSGVVCVSGRHGEPLE